MNRTLGSTPCLRNKGTYPIHVLSSNSCHGQPDLLTKCADFSGFRTPCKKAIPICQYSLLRMEGEVKVLREKFVQPDADRTSRLEDLCALVEGLYRSGSLSWATLSVDEDLGQILKARLQDPDP